MTLSLLLNVTDIAGCTKNAPVADFPAAYKKSVFLFFAATVFENAGKFFLPRQKQARFSQSVRLDAIDIYACYHFFFYLQTSNFGKHETWAMQLCVYGYTRTKIKQALPKHCGWIIQERNLHWNQSKVLYTLVREDGDCCHKVFVMAILHTTQILMSQAVICELIYQTSWKE